MEKEAARVAKSAKLRANISLILSILTLFVTFLGSSQQVFSFFGLDTPARAMKKTESVRKFVAAVANSDFQSLHTLVDVVAKDSFADKYVNSLYWIRAANQRQSGTNFTGFDPIASGSGWRVCVKGDSTNCGTYDEFRFDSSDAIIDCHREGLSLKEYIVSTDGASTEGDGVTAIPLAATSRLDGIRGENSEHHLEPDLPYTLHDCRELNWTDEVL